MTWTVGTFTGLPIMAQNRFTFDPEISGLRAGLTGPRIAASIILAEAPVPHVDALGPPDETSGPQLRVTGLHLVATGLQLPVTGPHLCVTEIVTARPAPIPAAGLCPHPQEILARAVPSRTDTDPQMGRRITPTSIMAIMVGLLTWEVP